MNNEIEFQVTFTVDLRALDDMAREAVIYEFSSRMYQICDRRSVSCTIERKVRDFPYQKCFSSVGSITSNLLYYSLFQHDANAVLCDSDLSKQLKSAAYSAVARMTGEIEDEVPVLMSGAGHDAMAMSHLTKVC